MKKLFALFIGLAALQTVACADDKPIALKDLPAAAQQFLQQYFPDVKATYAKVDNDLWGKNYDVLMADGSSVEFDKNGNWTDVSCKASQVPAAVIPQAIRNHVAQQHPDQRIVSIDRDSKDYEVKLSNGVELKFDLKFNLIGFDD